MSRKRKFRKLVGFFALLFFLISLGGGIWLAYHIVKNLPSPERIIERSVAQSTKIYDRTGAILLYEIHGGERRTVISLSSVPEYIKWATLAAEDINFYKHIGLDWKGITRALIKNLVKGNLGQGGSTITQQLVKNSILTPEKTFARKIKEALLALSIEAKYSKDEIMELYLNQIPYGSNAYGIDAASRIYFSKPVEELSLAEAAILAALPKAPTYYFSRKEELLQRKDWILNRMTEAGYITKEETERAKKQTIKFSLKTQPIIAPHFILYVRELLNEKYGEGFVERGGLKVITTLDVELQKKAEEAVLDGAKKNEMLVQAYNVSLVAINPKTGEILAMVGSRDYWEEPKPKGCSPGLNCKFDPHVNVALRKRQPGSAFKPFVYATAFKKGYTPETVLFDVPTEFNPLCNPDGTPGPSIKDEKDCYHPRNYDDAFRGSVTLRRALAQSLNVPSVKLLYLAGLEDSIKTARELGITTLTDPGRYGLSLVLGGAEVTLLEMTSAFGTFSQEGVLHPKTPILHVGDPDGKTLEKSEQRSMPVLDTEVARTVNDILSDNDARIPIFSPRSSLYFPDRQVAAKTGTTQDFRDAWVIGYTPSLVAGVWTGNNDNSPFNKSGLSVMVAGPIWHRFVESALTNQPAEDFTPPEKIVSSKPVIRGIYRDGPFINIDSISQKKATEHTPPEFIKEKGFGPVKTILEFIKKDSPLDEPPQDPTRDPQYKNWAGSLETWLQTNPIPAEDPPTEYDNIHSPQKRPEITLVEPPEGKSILEDGLNLVRAEIRRSFPLKEASLFIDDELVVSKTTYLISDVVAFDIKEPPSPGKHRIKIVAYDEVGNRGAQEVEITIP